MPTGYTAGIIDGTTTTFQEFAKNCARNFGAMIHMRDDDSNIPYKKREPTDYHQKELEKAQAVYEYARDSFDDSVLTLRKSQIEDEINSFQRIIDEHKKNREKLIPFLEKATSYVSPTPQHEGIRKFMIQQLDTTIEQDGDTDYYELEKIKRIAEFESLTPKEAREQLMSSAKWSVDYHTKENADEIKRCTESNLWVEQYFNSLD